MMKSGIHVFLTALLCDVWQLSRILSPGGGQRAEHDHAIFELDLLFSKCQFWGEENFDGEQVTVFASTVMAVCQCACKRDEE